MSNIAIRVENLSKRYRIGLKEEQSDTVVGAVGSFLTAPWRNFQRLRRLNNFEAESRSEQLNSINGKNNSRTSPLSPRNSSDLIWALKDVSFEVQQGKVVGIIGRNGAGKSTLLKIVSRITEPTGGRVELNGRVASLLEVGTGFHPELTGRENVFLNGAILGMTRAEIKNKFDEIVAFAEVEKFLDTPVKRYSSGMYVRLAFAVAAHLDPEILVVDEVLAVGDAEFQKKCLGKMQDITRFGRTVLFVSHNMDAISRLCSEALLVVDGELNYVGCVDRCIQKYMAALQPHGHSGLPSNETSVLKECRLLDSRGNPTQRIIAGQPAVITIRYQSHRAIKRPVFGVGITSGSGVRVCTLSTAFTNHLTEQLPASGTIRCEIPRVPFVAGSYVIRLGFDDGTLSERHEDVLAFEVTNANTNGRQQPTSVHGFVLMDCQWSSR